MHQPHPATFALAAYPGIVLCSSRAGRRRILMSRIKRFLTWVNYDILRAAVVAGLVLFALTYMCDAILYYLDIAAAKTILNDFAIALAGAVLLVIFLSQSRKNQIVEQAKAR